MTVKASGQISFLDIVSEFGAGSLTNNNNNISLGSYRMRQQLDTIAASGVGGTFYPIADGMPLPGQQISLSNFYSKTKTLIVEYKSNFISTTGRSLLSDCNNRLTLVGTGFSVFQISPQSNAFPLTGSILENIGTSKVVVSIAGSLGSQTNSQTNCALIIDSNFGNNLIIEVGPNAVISGGGGNGGNGGAVNSSGLPGRSGGSAIGITTVGIVTFNNRGRIQCGTGGGGGGAGGRNTNNVGGGGGGGAGYPPGNGGFGFYRGYAGQISIGGTGGIAVPATNNTRSGMGGTGGSTSPGLTTAFSGSAQLRNGTPSATIIGGLGGANGYKLVVAAGIATPVITPVIYGIVASRQVGVDTTSTPTLA